MLVCVHDISFIRIGQIIISWCYQAGIDVPALGVCHIACCL